MATNIARSGRARHTLVRNAASFMDLLMPVVPAHKVSVKEATVEGTVASRIPRKLLLHKKAYATGRWSRIIFRARSVVTGLVEGRQRG
jgi:hypothetical protein